MKRSVCQAAIALVLILSGCTHTITWTNDSEGQRTYVKTYLTRIPSSTMLLGTWYWDKSVSGTFAAQASNQDAQTFRADGSGSYFRDGSVCFEFSYELRANLLTVVSNHKNQCDDNKSSQFEILVSDAILAEKHLGTGYVTVWTHEPPPPSDRTVQPSGKTAYICWIKRVEKTSQGVDIYFTSARRVILRHGNEPPRTILVNPAAKEPASDEVAQGASSLISAVLGDQLFSANVPEDSCAMKVAKEGDAIGVEASASFGPAGLTPIHTMRFIPAD
jgi:hypothetical protein